MQFNFTVEELSFIVKRFKLRELLGFTEQKFKEKSAVETLLAKKYITPYNNSYELSGELRLLFSAWLNIRYTVVREDFINDDHVFALLASSRYIITYSEHFNDVTVTISDFDADAMDDLLLKYLDLDERMDASSERIDFNLTFSADDFLDYFSEKRKPINKVADKTGLTEGEIQELWDALACDDNLSVIIQDTVNDIGCLAVIHRSPGACIMFKHITPNTALHKQRTVVIKGSAESVIDSIYIL